MGFWLILMIGLLLLAGSSYLAILYFLAKLEVKASPREAMFECPRHGIFRKEHLISIAIFGDDEKPYESCPVCFDEKLKTPLDISVISK